MMHADLLSNDPKQPATSTAIEQLSPPAFLYQMKRQGIQRAFLIRHGDQVRASHPSLLDPLASFVLRSPAFAKHEAIFLGREDGLDSLFVAVVHSTTRGLGQGGLRFWGYDRLGDVLVDGLRLSQGMTRKNALAGLWWGGAKGIVTLPPDVSRPEDFVDRDARDRLFSAYGRFVATLGGVYYTAEDVGTTTEDMAAIFRSTRFVNCVPRHLGGSGNPSPHTAQGVLHAVRAAREFFTGSPALSGVRVAVQGAGNVGSALAERLHAAGAKLWITDVSPARADALARRLGDVTTVEPDAIYDLDVDVFAPCACGAVVNAATIPRLKAQLVCGAANNILAEPVDANRLLARGIAYIPDFVCNRMGIVNCADEWAGYLEEDVAGAAERVGADVRALLEYAQRMDISTTAAANRMADVAAAEPHPLLGGRGARLIARLAVGGWSDPEARTS